MEFAKYFLEKFGGDSIEETKDNYKNYTGKLNKRIIRILKNCKADNLAL